MSYCYPPRTVTDILLDIWPQPSPKKPERRQQCLEQLLDIQKKLNRASSDKEQRELLEEYRVRWSLCRRDVDPYGPK